LRSHRIYYSSKTVSGSNKGLKKEEGGSYSDVPAGKKPWESGSKKNIYDEDEVMTDTSGVNGKIKKRWRKEKKA